MYSSCIMYMLLRYKSQNNEQVADFCKVNTIWFDVAQISDNSLINVFKILPVSTDQKPELVFVNIEL